MYKYWSPRGGFEVWESELQSRFNLHSLKK